MAKGIGGQREKLVAELLVKDGWAVQRAQPSMRAIGPGKWMSARNDLWGCLDIAALKYGFPMLGIQVTSQENRWPRQRKVAAALGQHADPERLRLQVWCYTKGRGWKWTVWELLPSGEWDHVKGIAEGLTFYQQTLDADQASNSAK